MLCCFYLLRIQILSKTFKFKRVMQQLMFNAVKVTDIVMNIIIFKGCGKKRGQIWLSKLFRIERV